MYTVIEYVSFIVYSDTMGNKGAFITLKGGDLTPKYTSYEAVVSTIIIASISWLFKCILKLNKITFLHCAKTYIASIYIQRNG